MNFINLLVCFFLYINLANSDEIRQKTFSGFNGIISAFGDFNGDKYTDVFLKLNDPKCFQVIQQLPLKTEKDEVIFEVFKNLSKICVEGPIAGIIPSDFDGDALMDIAVLTKNSETSYGLTIWKGTGPIEWHDIIKDAPLFRNKDNITSPPLLLDYNGDMISDLLVLEKGIKGLSYFVYFGGKEIEREEFDANRNNITLGEFNSNAFIDLNGDGVSDIFLEEETAFYYYLAGSEGYKNFIVINKPVGYETIGSSTFFDIDNDEKIDHLIPVCKSKSDAKSCSILILDFETKTWKTLIENIKIGDNYFYFDESIIDKSNNINSPIRLRHGYVNENGFNDIMALMRSSKDKTWNIVLFSNHIFEKKSNENNFRITALNETIDGEPILATFFDLYEDGVIDIFVNYKSEKMKTHEFKSLTINDFAQVNFVKILVTSGLCIGGKCYQENVYGEDVFRTPYGTNSPGSMVCYQLVNSNNNAMKSCSGQLSQSSNFALQMPYTIFGLGLYANYIEKLKVTIPTGNTSVILSKKVEQIVPDSQIVFIPNPINDPNYWKVKLFLTPSDIIFKTLYTLIGICGILIILIIVLHRKEMLEDVKEQAEFKKQWPETRGR